MAQLVKTVNGLAIASVKTFDGLATASVKSILGVDNTAASDLLFAWHCETLDVTTGTPAGSSVGDTTGTAASAAAISPLLFVDGSNSLLIPTASDYVEFGWDSTTSPIVNLTAGTFDFYIRFATFADTDVMHFFIDGSNRIRVNFDATNSYIAMAYFGSGGGTANARTNTSVITAINTWYHVKCRWDTSAHSGLFTKVTADTTTGEGNSADNGTDPLPGVTGTSGTMNFGDLLGGSGAAFNLDVCLIYNNWQP